MSGRVDARRDKPRDSLYQHWTQQNWHAIPQGVIATGPQVYVKDLQVMAGSEISSA